MFWQKSELFIRIVIFPEFHLKEGGIVQWSQKMRNANVTEPCFLC